MVEIGFFGKVQLIVGSVGAGKSTFTYRFYNHLLPDRIKEKTMWSFIDFNTLPPELGSIRDWVCEKFISSFQSENEIDLYSAEVIDKVLAVEKFYYQMHGAES